MISPSATHRHSLRGQVLLITVLIVGMIVLVVGMSLALSGISEVSSGTDERQSFKAAALADGCAQESLLRLSRSTGFTGGTLTTGNGLCTMAVTGSGTWLIRVSATVDQWTRGLQVRAGSASGRIVILDWKHVTD